MEALRASYALAIRAAVAAARRYPDSARRLGLSGRVMLAIRVGSSGFVESVSVRTSSSFESLDRAAEAAAREVPHLPPPPGGPIDVMVPVVFSIRN
jgi:protein TonB